MSSDKKLGTLRMLLRALGLSQEAVDDVVDWIVDLLSGDGKGERTTQTPSFPYRLRTEFLSAAEMSFYHVLHNTLNGRVVVCTKVGLGDLFDVNTKDQSGFRTFRNKIDRRHVDFLLCESATMRPLVGIELDDKSHQRADRRERDEFVDGVFHAAGLPLVHVPAKRAYNTTEVAAALAPYLAGPALPTQEAGTPVSPVTPPPPSASEQALVCPQCGSPMLLRTARSGANTGHRFGGCSNYPRWRGIMACER